MISRKKFQHLEPLFKHLKVNCKHIIELSFSRIEEIIGTELSYFEKTDDRYWRQSKLKRLALKYSVTFGYIDGSKGTIHFLVQ